MEKGERQEVVREQLAEAVKVVIERTIAPPDSGPEQEHMLAAFLRKLPDSLRGHAESVAHEMRAQCTAVDGRLDLGQADYQAYSR